MAGSKQSSLIGGMDATMTTKEDARSPITLPRPFTLLPNDFASIPHDMAHAKTQVQAAKYPLPVSVNGLSKVRLVGRR